MSKFLFNDFQSVSSKVWKQKIQYELKGADYNETLVWKSNEGIDVKPFYHKDDLVSTQHPVLKNPSNWYIGQSIEASNAQDANLKAREAIERGAEAISFHLPKSIDTNTLLQNIDLTSIPVHLQCDFLTNAIFNDTKNFDFSASSKQNKLVLNIDIIGHLARTGNWYFNLKEDHLKFTEIAKKTGQLSIDIGLYQNAGATITQQLAYGLAHANEYLNHLDTEIEEKKNEHLQIIFNISVGSNYFFEIAKLRALRLLWHTLAKEYGCNNHCQIIASPSTRNKTIYDYNTNMLRTTTECMSAIIGGANMVINTPYDALYNNPNDFGERIARNQLLILKNESYFDIVNNPAEGSYYIESLTRDLAEKALTIFNETKAKNSRAVSAKLIADIEKILASN